LVELIEAKPLTFTGGLATMKHHYLLALFGLFLLIGGCSNIEGQPVEYNANGVPLKGYIAYDKAIKGKRPGILVVHEWWGSNEYVRKRARMLAGLGYTALAVDMYGEGKLAEHPDEAGKFANQIMQNLPLAKERFLAAYDLLKQQDTVDPDRIAAIGYCFGGAVVLQMATLGVDLDGVVSFHGGLPPDVTASPGQIKAKILILQGDDDKFVPPEQLNKLKEELEKADADVTVITYPGAKHSFTNPEADVYAEKFNLPIGYDPSADKQSWEAMKSFLSKIFHEEK